MIVDDLRNLACSAENVLNSAIQEIEKLKDDKAELEDNVERLETDKLNLEDEIEGRYLELPEEADQLMRDILDYFYEKNNTPFNFSSEFVHFCSIII